MGNLMNVLPQTTLLQYKRLLVNVGYPKTKSQECTYYFYLNKIMYLSLKEKRNEC